MALPFDSITNFGCYWSLASHMERAIPDAFWHQRCSTVYLSTSLSYQAGEYAGLIGGGYRDATLFFYLIM
ncbi:hypothetical protein OI450_09370 [Pectobacterium cacticida]|uniref:Uncharacterized protein n=1 Tax=Pectobacterium cacticida TaxID=69221 RepID=A0ABZ2G7C3_9GAMM|nr:hypothetical protein [Pectobacterium cacticida]UYX08528.1 hypothetical protein OI450_09370 [Pectobacterium cacticida]